MSLQQQQQHPSRPTNGALSLQLTAAVPSISLLQRLVLFLVTVSTLLRQQQCTNVDAFQPMVRTTFCPYQCTIIPTTSTTTSFPITLSFSNYYCVTTRITTSRTKLLMAKKRMAKKAEKVEISRSKAFYDAIKDANDEGDDKATTTTTTTTTNTMEFKKGKKNRNQPSSAKMEGTIETDGSSSTIRSDNDEQQQKAERERKQRADAAQRRMEQRPEVSTMIVDEESGTEILAQGKNVMDVVTRTAVKLSDDGPNYRMAQLFPGVPIPIRQQYRLDWKTVQVPKIIEALKDAAMIQLPEINGGTKGKDIPPHPSVTNRAIDFCLANRDWLGFKFKRTLGRLQMKSMSDNNKEEALVLYKLWKNYLTLDSHIAAPFRQMIMDAEGRIGPNFGNLDILSFGDGELYERTANYIVLKGMVAHWEKKVIDADYIERNPQTKDNYIRVLSRGDPKRYLPDPPILFTLKECTQVCAMAQQMTKVFVETSQLFDDLPPEVRFLEASLSIKGGTLLRQFAVEEFCPNESITPDALREGLRRLLAQLHTMQIDPYADIANILDKLINALSVGTDDERDPYLPYLLSYRPGDPGYFQTYTFDHEKLSLVRFLDSQYDGPTVAAPTMNGGDSGGGGKFANLLADFSGGGFGLNKRDETATTKKVESYRVPQERASGRPHNLGWLNLLDDVIDKDNENNRLGKLPPGKIIMD